MAIIKTKTRGKTYYQVRNGNKVIKTLGSEQKILMVFSIYEELLSKGLILKDKNTESFKLVENLSYTKKSIN